ncbi:MAG: FmdB family zinc ribbon protein [Vicinamibacterales bacterium]
MPLYEYQCEACGHRFEIIQKYSDAPIAVCPKCGGTVRKLFSSPAIQFKGSGFYITDYARSGKTDAEGASEAKGESGNGTGEKKPGAAEAKSESKAEKAEKAASKDATKSESKSESKAEPSSSKPSASKPTSD